MKLPCVFFVLLLWVLRVAADTIKLPATAFRMAQLEDASKQAATEKKPVAFVLSQEFAEGITFTATEDAFKELKSWAVIVFVESKEKGGEAALLPPPLATTLREGVQRTLPCVFLCPPSMDDVWVEVGAKQKQSAKDFRKELGKSQPAVKTKAATFFKEKTPPPPVLPGDKQLSWGLTKGGFYRGKFVRLEDDKLFITDDKGAESGGIELKDLAPATQRYIRFIAAAAPATKPESSPAASPAPDAAPGAAPVPDSPAAPAPAAAASLENWQNKTGKVIKAAFVSLKDDKVTLRMESGKEYILPLGTLALTSQVRARELARASSGEP
jgi:hypothetical protein